MERAEDTLFCHATASCLASSWLAVKVLVHAERRHRRVGAGMVDAGGSGSCRSSGCLFDVPPRSRRMRAGSRDEMESSGCGRETLTVSVPSVASLNSPRFAHRRAATRD